MPLIYVPSSLVTNSWFVVGAPDALDAVNNNVATPEDDKYLVGFTTVGGIGNWVAWQFNILLDPNTQDGWKIRIRTKRPSDIQPLIPVQIVLAKFNEVKAVYVPPPTAYGFDAWKDYEILISEAVIQSFGNDYSNLRVSINTPPDWPNAAQFHLSEIEVESPSVVLPVRKTSQSIEVLGYWPLPAGNSTLLTSNSIEVLNTYPAALVTSAAIEVLSKLPILYTDITKQFIEVLSKSSLQLNITTSPVEVLAKYNNFVRATSQAIEVLKTYVEDTTPIRITKGLLEILSKTSVNPVFWRGSRLSIEVLSKLVVPAVVPLEYGYIPGKIFIIDWMQQFRLSTAFITSISSAVTGYEQRIQKLERPYRTLQFNLLSLSQDDIASIRSYNRDRGTVGLPIPIYSDYTKTVTESLTGTQQIECNTQFRRFYKGQRIAIHWWSNNRPAFVGFYKIEVIFDNYIVIDSPLEFTYPANSRVYPMLDAEVSFNIGAQLTTKIISHVPMEAIEVIGESTLLTYDKNLLFEQYEEFDIFPFKVNWFNQLDHEQLVEGYSAALGRGTVTELTQERPDDLYSGIFTALSRQKVFEYVSFFNKHQGMTRSFWFMIPEDVFSVITIQPEFIFVECNLTDFDFEDYQIGIEYFDGTIDIRRIALVEGGRVDMLSQFTIFFFDGEEIDTTNIKKIGLAFFGRFNSDACEETWISDEACNINVSVIRRQFPKNVEIKV